MEYQVTRKMLYPPGCNELMGSMTPGHVQPACNQTPGQSPIPLGQAALACSVGDSRQTPPWQLSLPALDCSVSLRLDCLTLLRRRLHKNRGRDSARTLCGRPRIPRISRRTNTSGLPIIIVNNLHAVNRNCL